MEKYLVQYGRLDGWGWFQRGVCVNSRNCEYVHVSPYIEVVNINVSTSIPQ